MRSLDAARQRARTRRAEMPGAPSVLLEHLEGWLEDEGFDLVPASPAYLDGGAALLSPDEGVLYYDEGLDADPVAKLVVLAHERGHLELHDRVRRVSPFPDTIQGSAYYGDGAPGAARYHRLTREEAEATAFATEYVCPSQDVFEQWQTGLDPTALATQYGVSESLVRVQLAQALFEAAVGTPSGAGPDVPLGNTPERLDDPSQEAASRHLGSSALVRAGPGTGKTATLIRRIEFLLGERGVDPNHLLVLTFSTDAAEEVRLRIGRRFGEEAGRRMEVQTFHGFGWSVLRFYGHLVGLSEEARILDEVGTGELIRSLIGQPALRPLFDLADAAGSVRRASETITQLKDQASADGTPLTPDHVARALAEWAPSPEHQDDYARADALLGLFRTYEAEKARRQLADFADLIALPARILSDHPDVRNRYRSRYPWVLVDEYQDVSRTVALLLQQLCGPDNPVWAVGDDHQAIYRFRGAAPENVTAFSDDFPGAAEYALGFNYRACPELVATACGLAALLDDPTLEDTEGDVRWRPASSQRAFNGMPLRLAHAASEQAEVEGVVRQVEAWILAGALPESIAVLGRRNIDVRNVTLALGRRGIRAAASALVTAEGNAGLLAALVTLPERPRTAFVRLAAALGRHLPVETQNEAIQALLTTEAPAAEAPITAEASGLVESVRSIAARLSAGRFTDDAFDMMTVFLFDGGTYLRTLLGSLDAITRALDLSEVVTSLSRAAAYRFTHPRGTATARRVGFAQHFRYAVAHTSPSHVPAPHPPGAVRVMTAHAAKGLEFPLVALVGQIVPNIPRGPLLLPPTLRSAPDEERLQADALLFVGATRAQRGLLVSFAPKKTPNARPSDTRALPALLERWRALPGVPVEEWEHFGAEAVTAPVRPVWGGAALNSINASALAPSSCELAQYLSRALRLNFLEDAGDLFPAYVNAVRRAIQVVTRQHFLDPDATIEDTWPAAETAGHPHAQVYREAARDTLTAFVAERDRLNLTGVPVEDTVMTAEGMAVRLGLLVRVQRAEGVPLAVALHMRKPLLPKVSKGRLSWSHLGSSAKVAFSVLYHEAGGTDAPEIFLFSGPDGALIPAQWNRNAESITAEAARALEQARGVREQTYRPAANAHTCDDCEHRIVCPFWLKLTGPET